MPTLITLTSAKDSIVFAPTPDLANGWVYNNATLDAWYRLADIEAKLNKRPNAHGTYTPDQLFAKEHRPVISGQHYATSASDAMAARNRLLAMFNDGQSVIMQVADDYVTTTREVWLIESSAPFRYDFAHFPFDIVFVAPDPRRYALPVSAEDGLPMGSSGLVWNLGTAGSGLFFDWGTPGRLGRVAFTNRGQAATLPVIEVGGAGGFDVGFRVTEIETGRELAVARVTAAGDIIRLDSLTERATLNGGDVTNSLTRRQWFSVPAGETRNYQLTPTGSTTGAPTIKLTAASAFM